MNRQQRRAARAIERVAPDAWMPLVAAEYKNIDAAVVEEIATRTGRSVAEVLEAMQREGDLPVFINHLYQVQVRQLPDGWTHLNIRRRDGNPIFRDWRHFQNIKNQLCGPEREAIELYPAESRLVDTSNKYHLWVLPEGEQFPIGFLARDVLDHDSQSPGIAQRSMTP
jgi:hypothetical protein